MTKVSETKKQKTPVKESQQRGTVLFPLQYNYCNTANPFYDLWLHWHTEFEIIHVVSGCYRIFINDHEILLNEGDVCLVPGKVVHGDAPDKGVGKFESAVFDIELMRLHGFSPDAFISEIVNGTITIENVYRLNECKDISRTVTSFFEAIRDQREGWEAISTGYLIILFGLINKNKLYSEKKILPAKKRVRNEKLELVFDLIKKNYMKNITLEELADAAGFSPKYFCRVFREMTNRAPVEYLNWFRINRSCAMIRETDEKLQDIAVKCGFNDFSYFIKIFHRYKNMTPLKYRNYKENNNSDVNIDSDAEYEALFEKDKENE
ncbi:helix-turn-helix domain-containing protein [Treponema sp.]|uniref:AraC family transcriptional regulator n=1 Tax=Treponema sp. TaxID=166 RepID=UPI001D93EF9C|nr:AraC family transcriptional regulator [Treponema sp.]MBS7241877.1 AraC family transcriptional regulator [Treponema sp.]MCI6443196.1 AraC family transcriptional regulator [Spirochaetia bacterium]MDY4132887.1 AraC family transcriptional regulator [Treponema sp.]